MTSTGRSSAAFEPNLPERAAAGMPVLVPEQVLAELEIAARRAGIAVEAERSREWLVALLEALTTEDEWAYHAHHGIAGHELVLVDFDPAWTNLLREIGQVVATPDSANVRAGLAIAGSAALGRAHPYPSDIDYFERVHITAPTREDACQLLLQAIRDVIARAAEHAGFRFEELMLGVANHSVLRWTPEDFARGAVVVASDAGSEVTIRLEEAVAKPGFIKLDWIVDRVEVGGPWRVSKVIDATWQSPNGGIVGLDGAIDGDYQQVYLDADGAALAAAIAGILKDGIADYVIAMEREAAHYAQCRPPDFVKVAKRLYNLCRFTHRFGEALFLRELFDEPAARIHQVRVRLELAPQLDQDDLLHLQRELEDIATEVSRWCEEREAALKDRCLGLALTEASAADQLAALAPVLSSAASRAFECCLRAHPTIADLIGEITARHPEA